MRFVKVLVAGRVGATSRLLGHESIPWVSAKGECLY